jgi:hypothetical protein
MKLTGMWFLAAGVLLSIRGAIEFADPVYWNPSSALDYSAALLTTMASVVTGVAFVLWWRTTPIRRGSWLLPVAGVQEVVSGIGNFLEDILDMEFGAVLFELGGAIGSYALLAAAALILTVRNPLRWSALLLITYIAGFIFPDIGGEFLSGASLVALGLWLVRYRPPDDLAQATTHR